MSTPPRSLRRTGFGLVELLVVAALGTIVIGVGLLTLMATTRRLSHARDRHEVRVALERAVESLVRDWGGRGFIAIRDSDGELSEVRGSTIRGSTIRGSTIRAAAEGWRVGPCRVEASRVEASRVGASRVGASRADDVHSSRSDVQSSHAVSHILERGDDGWRWWREIDGVRVRELLPGRPFTLTVVRALTRQDHDLQLAHADEEAREPLAESVSAGRVITPPHGVGVSRFATVETNGGERLEWWRPIDDSPWLEPCGVAPYLATFQETSRSNGDVDIDPAAAQVTIEWRPEAYLVAIAPLTVIELRFACRGVERRVRLRVGGRVGR